MTFALADAGPGQASKRSPSERRLVTFYLAHEPDLDLVRGLDPDRDLHGFRRGERSWVAQTYLRLRAAGWPVELSENPAPGGLIVFHAKPKRALAKVARRLERAVSGETGG